MGGGGVLGQFAGHGRREGARQAPDPLTQVSGVTCGRQHQDTGSGEAGGRDRDAVVQGRWEDDMVVFGQDEGSWGHAFAAELYLVGPRHLYVVYGAHQ